MYQSDMADFLAKNGAIFFAPGLRLKDGRPTPYFINLGAINTGRLGLTMAGFFSRMLVAEDMIAAGDVLIGPSYKGSSLATMVAASLWQNNGIEVGFDYDRKEAKIHGEATGAHNLFVTGALKAARRALIVDDVATSLATKVDLIEKMRAENPEAAITAVVIAVDREQTQPVYDANGRLVEGARGNDAVSAFLKQTGVPVKAVAGVRAVVEHLFRTRTPLKISGRFRPRCNEWNTAW